MAFALTAVREASAAAERPHITIRGLTKRFNEMVVYDKFDLDIPRGKIISVFGPNTEISSPRGMSRSNLS